MYDTIFHHKTLVWIFSEFFDAKFATKKNAKIWLVLWSKLLPRIFADFKNKQINMLRPGIIYFIFPNGTQRYC